MDIEKQLKSSLQQSIFQIELDIMRLETRILIIEDSAETGGWPPEAQYAITRLQEDLNNALNVLWNLQDELYDAEHQYDPEVITVDERPMRGGK